MTRASWPTTGAASARSRPLPWGRPSTMSTRTTSARPASAIRWAVVAPTLPAPMTVTLWRAMRVRLQVGPEGRDGTAILGPHRRHSTMPALDRGRCRRLGRALNVVSTNEPSGANDKMTSILTGLGILLVIFAIPFGLMLAPLILGAILLVFGLRRASRAFQPLPASPVGEPA